LFTCGAHSHSIDRSECGKQKTASANIGSTVIFEILGTSQMKVTTTETIAGRLVEETLGVVRGAVLWSRSVMKYNVAGMRGLNYSGLDDMAEGLQTAKDGAEAKAMTQAQVLGADAIINLRYELMEISTGVFQAVATGTAVKTSSLQTALPIMALADNDDATDAAFVPQFSQPQLRLVSNMMH
jgi:uncharacterized protein YbjQ (UPF0145 family)